MRGSVALAAVLSLPTTVDGGGPMPGRDLVIVLTLIVIVVTLVGQGLTLRPLVQRLGLTDPDERASARRRTPSAPPPRPRSTSSTSRPSATTSATTSATGSSASTRCAAPFGGEATEAEKRQLKGEEQTDLELLDAARDAVLELEERGEIRAEVAQEVLRELDLDSARLRG